MSALFADQLPGPEFSPLETVEQLLVAHDWPFERVSEDEITASVPGQWSEYHLRFFWREDGRVLQVACVFDSKVPDNRRSKIYETLALINERMWIGHFELWSDECVLMYRHAALIDIEAAGRDEQVCGVLIETALSECERFYPVFQFVIWAGKEPAEAIEAAMLETVGEA